MISKLKCMHTVEIRMKVHAGMLGLEEYLLLLEEVLIGRPFTTT